jgi:putative ABC transport system permease protein
MMIPARWSKVLKDLWQNKLRAVLIVLSIAVGLFAVGTILSTRAILSTEMARSYAAIRPSGGIVRTWQPFDEDFVVAMGKTPGVADIDARRALDVRAQTGTGDWRSLRLFAVADYDAMRVDLIRPVSGAWPPPDRSALIERSALPLLGLMEGETLLVETAVGQQRALVVAGVAHDMVQVPAQFDGTPYAYVSLDTIEWLGEPYGFNELHIVAADPDNAQQVVNAIKTKAEKSGYIIPVSLAAEPGQLPLDDILQAVLVLMGALGLLSLFLSAFLIINTVSALLAQQKQQIGVMKALGASNGQLLAMYLALVEAYGVLALVLAIPASVVGARELSRFVAALFNFDLPGMPVMGTAVFTQIAIGLLVPLLASLFPLVSNLRASAAQAMRSTGMGAPSRIGWVDRALGGANLWFARRVLLRPWLLSLRNTFRSRGRLALTLTTLSLAGAIFISVFNVRASLTMTIDQMLSWWNFDVLVTLAQPYRVERLDYEARQVPGVVASDVWMQLPVRRVRPDGTESGLIYLFAQAPDSQLAPPPAVVVGRTLQPGDTNALVINAIVQKEEPDLDVGDVVVLKIDGRERPFEIVGVSLGVLFPMVHASHEYVGHLTADVNRASTLLVGTANHDEATITASATALAAHFRRVGLSVSEVQTIVAERAEIEASFNIIISLLLAMASLLALVGGLGLMGAMSINVLERTREIGVLRAIGAPNRGVATVFIREGVAIGLLSWAIGVLLAVPLSKMLGTAVGVPLMGVPPTYVFAPTGVWLWLLLVIVLSALASFIPARNAARLTVREVLAYE